MTTFKLRLNTLFILLLTLTVNHISSNEKEAFHKEITTAEELSRQNGTLYYCLIISPKESDQESIAHIINTTQADPSLQLLFFVRKELQYPTLYLFHDGILQYRRKISKEPMQEAFTSITNYLHHKAATYSDSHIASTTPDNAIALMSLSEIHFTSEDHLKKIIIAIIIVLLLSIILVLITKYSIDWAISSRLDLNIEKDIRKKEAVDSLVESTYKRTDMQENTKTDFEFS